MPSMTLKNMIGTLVLAVMVTACVDAPSEPLAATAPPNNPLATTFDQLAVDQLSANDVERSEEFRWAALAVRAGVTPSALHVTNEGRAEVYDAFVHAVTWVSLTQALRPPLHRSLVAWRRSGDIFQVILIGMVTDSAPVVHPYSLRPTMDPVGPLAGAKAAYFERGPVSSSWVGVGGTAKVAEHPEPRSCPAANEATKPDGVNCQLTRFGVGFNAQFARTRTRDSREVDALAPTRRIVVSPQVVAGVKLVLTCSVPSATGC